MQLINLFSHAMYEQTDKYNLTSFLQYSKGFSEDTTLTLSKQLSEEFDKETGMYLNSCSFSSSWHYLHIDSHKKFTLKHK